MFDKVGEKPVRTRRWTFIASALLNAGVIGAVIVSSMWKIEKVQAKGIHVSLGLPMASPPPPPGDPAPAAVKDPPKKKVAKVSDKVVQPTPVTPHDPDPQQQTASQTPGENGPPDGIPGGHDPNGPPTAPPTDEPVVKIDPPPVDDKPKTIAVNAVEALRISGTREISLPQSVRQIMVTQGLRQTSAMVKLCLSAAGVPTQVTVVKGTGYSEADEHLRSEMLDWRYRPLTVNGAPTAVCTAVSFHWVLD